MGTEKPAVFDRNWWADPFAIMKAMGHADIKTTMIYGSLGQSHIRDQVERLNAIATPKSAYKPSRVHAKSSPVAASATIKRTVSPNRDQNTDYLQKREPGALPSSL
ncbi:MAG: hypothetical protein ACM31I_09440 [Deltaproteobacteria bacterium]